MTTTSERIAARAYQLFLERGGEHGHDEEDWRQAERELRGVSVVLTDAGKNKIALVKELRVITGLDLEAVKHLVETTPSEIRHQANAADAEQIRRRLTGLGASVELRD